MGKRKNKFTAWDWKVMIIGVILFSMMIVLRVYLTARIPDWILSNVLDLIIGIFGSGVLLFIFSEIFGKSLINSLTR